MGGGDGGWIRGEGHQLPSGKRAGLLAAPLAPRGAWDVSEEKAPEKEP